MPKPSAALIEAARAGRAKPGRYRMLVVLQAGLDAATVKPLRCRSPFTLFLCALGHEAVRHRDVDNAMERRVPQAGGTPSATV